MESPSLHWGGGEAVRLNTAGTQLGGDINISNSAGGEHKCWLYFSDDYYDYFSVDIDGIRYKYDYSYRYKLREINLTPDSSVTFYNTYTTYTYLIINGETAGYIKVDEYTDPIVTLSLPCSCVICLGGYSDRINIRYLPF